jgi:hypothetical protein
MSGALLNYTTTIAVDKTLTEIQRVLVKAGARSILTDYDGEGNPSALSFLIKTQFGDRSYRLPADIEAVWRVLTRQYDAGRVQRRFATREQAARVGWRILKDWLEAQLAIIETQMVTLDQVLLPYMQDQVTGQPIYELLVERNMKLLTAPESP